MADQFRRISVTLAHTALIKLRTIAVNNNLTDSRALSLLLDAQNDTINLTEKKANGESKKAKRG
jgi:hypothetical protein